MEPPDPNKFFDALRTIDNAVDDLRQMTVTAYASGVMGGYLARRYVFGDPGKEYVLEVIVRHEDEAKEKPSAMKEALAGLVEAVTIEVNEKGAGGFLLARLADARTELDRRKRRK